MRFSVTAFCLGTVVAPVFAGQCTDIGVAYRCGRITNQSNKVLSYTTNPNDSKAPHFCRFWNWEDGPSNSLVPCTQKTLAKGGSAGCGLCSKRGTDVDAFTFNDSDYSWQGTKVKKGVWTKFNNFNSIKCEDKSIHGIRNPSCN